MTKKLILSLFFVLFCGLALSLTTLGVPPSAADPVDVTPLPPVTDPDGRLGVCYGFYEEPPDSGQRPYLDLMYDAGARHDRWDFRWTAIQPNNQGQWDWYGVDRIVRAERAKGVDVLGILLWTPQWASTYEPPMDLGWWARLHAQARFYAHTGGPLGPKGFVPGDNYPPKNLDQPVFVDGAINPENYWGYYVYHVARRFDGASTGDPALRVDAWEVWNEPEWEFFWVKSATATEDYCRLLKVAYQAIKGDGTTPGGNPDATVLFGGLHYWINPGFYAQVLDCLAADPDGPANNYFFDVMSVHFYSRSDNAHDRIQEIKAEMAARGMGDHPVWLTETGAPMYGDASPGYPVSGKRENWLSIDEEAAYVIQSFANALAAGVERYYFFRAHDADMGEPHGLIRNDQSLRPAYVAYQVAAQYLRGENGVTRVTSGGITQVNLWGTPRGKVSVLWNRTPQPLTYTLPAAMPTATQVDRWGVTRTLEATNDVYTLPLPVATANLVSDPSDYIVGGDPLILIETDTLSPTSALAALPPLIKRPAVTLTWTAGDADSGVWYTEIQVSTSPGGPWRTVAGLSETQGMTQTAFYSRRDATYYFRARARDNVGNWEPWPVTFEVSTTVDVNVELDWSVDALFNDSDGDGEWDQGTAGGTGWTGTLKPEVALEPVAMRFVDETGTTLSVTVSDAWHFTMTLVPGTYTFVALAEDPVGDGWIRFEPVTVTGMVDPLVISLDALGLWPRQDVYLPLLFLNR